MRLKQPCSPSRGSVSKFHVLSFHRGKQGLLRGQEGSRAEEMGVRAASLSSCLSPEEPWEASEGSRAERVGVRADPLHVARPLLSRGACVVDAVLTPALSFQKASWSSDAFWNNTERTMMNTWQALE